MVGVPPRRNVHAWKAGSQDAKTCPQSAARRRRLSAMSCPRVHLTLFSTPSPRPSGEGWGEGNEAEKHTASSPGPLLLGGGEGEQPEQCQAAPAALCLCAKFGRFGLDWKAACRLASLPWFRLATTGNTSGETISPVNFHPRKPLTPLRLHEMVCPAWISSDRSNFGSGWPR